MTGMKGDRARPAGNVSLPQLSDFDAGRLEKGHDYDAIAFTDQDFTGQDASDARFLECRLDRCRVDGLTMRRARIVDCWIADANGASVDLADSTWRDSQMTGGRLGAAILAGAKWNGIQLRGVKLGYLSLAGARLADVVFEDCEIGSLDASSAQLRSVAFVGCSVQELNVLEATLSKVDLSRSTLRSVIGVDSLRGAILSPEQLIDLAPMLAAQLGIEVRPD